jgi:hypothetical protein
MGDMYKNIERIMKTTNGNHFGFDGMTVTEMAQYTEYPEGGFYDWHVDNDINMQHEPPVRKISMTCFPVTIGGSVRSQHVEGRALDLDGDVYGKVSNAEIFEYIRENLEFDQLIWEFGTEDNPDWVHVSYVYDGINRGRCLKACRDDEGKTYYKVIFGKSL